MIYKPQQKLLDGDSYLPVTLDFNWNGKKDVWSAVIRHSIGIETIKADSLKIRNRYLQLQEERKT